MIHNALSHVRAILRRPVRGAFRIALLAAAHLAPLAAQAGDADWRARWTLAAASPPQSAAQALRRAAPSPAVSGAAEGVGALLDSWRTRIRYEDVEGAARFVTAQMLLSEGPLRLYVGAGGGLRAAAPAAQEPDIALKGVAGVDLALGDRLEGFVEYGFVAAPEDAASGDAEAHQISAGLSLALY